MSTKTIDITDLEELDDYDLHLRYDELLDEIYPDCSIANMKYNTSRALKELDPTAYRCGFSDWLDNELTDGIFIEHNDKFYLAE